MRAVAESREPVPPEGGARAARGRSRSEASAAAPCVWPAAGWRRGGPAALVATVVLLAVPARAENLADVFSQAAERYWAGDFAGAAAGFERIVDHFGIENATLYYDLGTAYARSGKLGKAVLCFKRALRLDPDDALRRAIVANLARTRRELVERYRKELPQEQFLFVDAGGFWTRVFQAPSRTVVRWLFLATWVVLFTWLAWIRLRGARSAWTWAAIAVLATASLVSGTFYAGSVLTARHVQTGVVVAHDVTLQEGLHPSAPTHPIPEGIEVRILDRTDPEYVRVELPNGLTGWVPREAVGPVEHWHS